MGNIEYLETVCAIISEILCSMLIINGLQGKRKDVRMVWSILFILAETVYIMFIPSEEVYVCYFFTLLYVKIGYRVPWKESVITLILSLVIGGLVELISLFPFLFIFNNRLSDNSCKLLAALESVALCYIILKRIPIWYLKKWCNKQEILYIAVLFFSLILIITKIIDYNMTLELELADYLYIMIGLSLLWLLSTRLMRYYYEKKIRSRYFKAFENVIEQIRNRQHKFQNHLDAVYSLHNIYSDYKILVEEQKRYLQRLTDYEMPAQVMALKNPILIAHVYEKMIEAQESGLRMRIKLKCSLEKCEVDEIYMIEILGTLFDNAIQDMKQNGKTEFLVFEVEKGDGIVIRIANPHVELKNQEMKRMFQRGYSTKGCDR